MAAAKTAATPARRTRAAASKKALPLQRAATDKADKPESAASEAAHQKVVRDGFTMPKADYDTLKSLKAQCLKSGVDVKKSELLRAGVQALAGLPAKELLDRMRALPAVKAGRKKK